MEVRPERTPARTAVPSLGGSTMPHPAPTTPAGGKYTDTDLEPIRDALAALANGAFRAPGGRYSEGTRGAESGRLADIGSLLDEGTSQLSSLTSEVTVK